MPLTPRQLSPLGATTAGEGRQAPVGDWPPPSPAFSAMSITDWHHHRQSAGYAGADEAQAHEARDARQKKFTSYASQQGRKQEPGTPNGQIQNSGYAGARPATADGRRTFLVPSPGARRKSYRQLYALATFKKGTKNDQESCQDGSTSPKRQPEFGAAGASEKVRNKLNHLSVTQLIRRATRAGVSEEWLEKAEEQAEEPGMDHKQAVIDVIMQQENEVIKHTLQDPHGHWSSGAGHQLLARVPCEVSFTGLLDSTEQNTTELRRALLHAAGCFCGAAEEDHCKTCDEEQEDLVPEAQYWETMPDDTDEAPKEAEPGDRATWSAHNLEGKTIEELAEFRVKGCAGVGIESRVRFPIALLPLKPYTNNLLWGKKMWLFPEDKYQLTESSHKPTKLYLRTEAFETGTKFVTKAELGELRKYFFGDKDTEEPFVLLSSSPLSALTLTTAERKRSSIPEQAKFYSFCCASGKGSDVDENPYRGEGGQKKCERITNCPFVKWLAFGGFVYYDHQYDIVGINALSFEPDMNRKGVGGSLLYFSGMDAISTAASQSGHAHLEPSVVAALDGLNRWWPVTNLKLKELGYEKFTWINPSEFLGGYIFPRHGGFAYRSRKDHLHKSKYYPVQGKADNYDHDERYQPTAYSAPIFIPGISGNNPKPGDEQSDMSPTDDHKFHHAEAHFSHGEAAALGLDGMLEGRVLEALEEARRLGPAHQDKRDALELAAIRKEVEDAVKESVQAKTHCKPSKPWHKYATEKDIKNVDYIIGGTAHSGKNQANDGSGERLYDVGMDEARTSHHGWKLEDFMTGTKRCEAMAQKAKELEDEAATPGTPDEERAKLEEEARQLRDEMKGLSKFWPAAHAKLRKAEVVALRLYTTSTFRLINYPLRECGRNFEDAEPEQMSHWIPLPVTTSCINTGLKKLRACHMGKKFEERYLWRGLKDKDVSTKFELEGGTEFACMSATEDMQVMARYAKSTNPLVFRIKVETPMDMGADISWLSVYPDEKEVLYPPMTFLKPLYKQDIRDLPPDQGKVITVSPAFST